MLTEKAAREEAQKIEEVLAEDETEGEDSLSGVIAVLLLTIDSSSSRAGRGGGS